MYMIYTLYAFADTMIVQKIKENKKKKKDKKTKKEYSNLTMYTVIIANVRQLVKTFFALSHRISLYFTFICLHCSVFYK